MYLKCFQFYNIQKYDHPFLIPLYAFMCVLMDIHVHIGIHILYVREANVDLIFFSFCLITTVKADFKK